MSFPKYESYKDSGVEWLGEVPEHWEVKPVKNVASIVNGYPFDSKLFDPAEGHPLIRIRDLNKSEPETFYNGDFVESAAITSDDVLIGMDGDFNVGRWYGQGKALLNQRMCCVRGKTRLLTKLLEYSLAIPLKAINEVTYATTVKHLASSQVEKSFCAISPDTNEQYAIVAFLDRETAKIDDLIAEQQHLIALLTEKRQAVISHAVTKGLNPDVPMKDSGVEWLGEVPEHWGCCLLKRAFRSVDYGISESLSPEGAIAILRMGNILNGKVVIDDLKYIDSVDTFLLLEEGDLLYNRTNSLDLVGKVGMFLGTDFPVSFASYLVRLRTVNESLPDYFAYLLNTDGILGLARANAFVAIGQCNLNPTRYGQIIIAVPPYDEQVAITKHLNDVTSKLDDLIVEAQRGIGLLHERRSALISAAVTGKIDVRGAVLARPDSELTASDIEALRTGLDQLDSGQGKDGNAFLENLHQREALG